MVRAAIGLMACVLVMAVAMALPARAQGVVEVVTTANFAEKVLQSPLPVVLQFDAAWCPYCRKVQPLLADLAADKAGQVNVYRLDVDADKNMAMLFGVQSLPTIVLVKQGQEVARIKGVPSKAKLYLFSAK